MDDVLDLTMNHLISRHAAQSTKPPELMIAVRIALSPGFLLAMDEAFEET